MKISTLGSVIAVLFACGAAAIVYLELVETKELSQLGTTWEQFDRGTALKIALLSDLRAALGSGGMIHEFKNSVLRRDHPRLRRIRARLRESASALLAYESLAAGERERTALANLKRVLERYEGFVAVSEEIARRGADRQKRSTGW